MAPLARRLRIAGRVPITDLRPNKEATISDLADAPSVLKMTEGVDTIVHLGDAALETNWETILNASIRGSHNLYEGTRRNGVKRVVYVTSVHAIGYRRSEGRIDANAPHRPGRLYGVSKCVLEDLSRLYWDKFGIETARCRIFSSFDEYSDRRMLWSMLTFDNCVRLVEACRTAPRVAHSIVFGTSANRHQMVDNRGSVSGRGGNSEPMTV